MSNELNELKADIKEVREGQREMLTAFNDLRVLVAGNYVTKTEFSEYKKSIGNDLTDHKKENSTTNRWFAGICVTIGLFILGLFFKG